MTNEETIAYFKEYNERLVSVAKDENVYDYEKQVIEAVCMKETFDANEMAIQALEQQPCEDCIRELIREFDNKHPALFADYMREFNNHPISEIIEYMWDMHDLIEDIKYRLPNEGGAESEDNE